MPRDLARPKKPSPGMPDDPYATALRRVHKLIDEGWIERRPRTKSGKTFTLYPSEKLLAGFLDQHTNQRKEP